MNRLITLVRPVTKTVKLVNMQKRNFLTVVQQAEIAYREFLGANRTRLEPGLRLNLPILHTVHRVDMKENNVHVKTVCFTKDTVPVSVSGTLFFKVFDAEKACFSVTNYVDSVWTVGDSAVRATIGTFNYKQIIDARASISSEVQTHIGDNLKKWGVQCTQFELQDFGPQNKDVANSLEKEMKAERDRRENELHVSAKIRSAEGERDIAKLAADGKLYKEQKEAEAIQYTINQETDALAIQIKKLKENLPHMSEQDLTSFLIETKRLKHLESLANNPAKTTYFVSPEKAFPSVIFDSMKLSTDVPKTK